MTSKLQALIGRRIGAIRKSNKIEIGTLANLIGMSTEDLELIELGFGYAGPDVLVRIAEALGVPLKVLFRDETAGSGPHDRPHGLEEAPVGAESWELARLVWAFDNIADFESRMSVVEHAEVLAFGQRQ